MSCASTDAMARCILAPSGRAAAWHQGGPVADFNYGAHACLFQQVQYEHVEEPSSAMPHRQRLSGQVYATSMRQHWLFVLHLPDLPSWSAMNCGNEQSSAAWAAAVEPGRGCGAAAWRNRFQPGQHARAGCGVHHGVLWRAAAAQHRRQGVGGGAPSQTPGVCGSRSALIPQKACCTQLACCSPC